MAPLALLLLLQAAPFPGAVLVDGGWVPCSHPIAIERGLGCTATPQPPPPPQEDDCLNVNPYADPDRAARCAARPPKATPPVVFAVGKRYYYGYPSAGVYVCLGVLIGADGHPVAVLQVVDFAPERHLQVVAVRQDQSSNWQLLTAREVLP